MSKELQDPNTGNKSIVWDVADKIYIGCYLPFAGQYFKRSAGGAAANITARFWSGDEFRDTVDTWDQTNGLQDSGYIYWTIDKAYSWTRQDTVDANGDVQIPELSDLTIYDLYWLELSTDTQITVTLEWVRQLFSQSDEDIRAEYSDLLRSNTLTALGVSDYENTRFRASEIIENHLRGKNDINGDEQIIKPDDLKLACVCKTAELIYSLLGDDFEDQEMKARERFIERVKPNAFTKDKNNNGRLDPSELSIRQVEFNR